MGWSRAAASLYRALLVVYPAEFRLEYGSEMAQLFEDRLRSESQLRLWLDSIADIGTTVLREHYHIFLSDLRQAVRMIAKAPAFASIALGVIAIGIAATTAIFSLVNAVLLRSMPFGHAESLVYMWSPNPNFKGVPKEIGPNVPDFYDWERLSHSLSRIALFRQTSVNLVLPNSTTRVGAAFVTGSFFSTLESPPELGRAIDTADDRPGHEHVAVISDGLWRSRLGSAPDVLGKRIQLNRRYYTVVGVMPKGFAYPSEGDVPYEHSELRQTDIWLPAAYTVAQRGNRTDFDSADAIGRLRNGISPARAEAEVAAIEARLQPLYPEMWRGWSVLVTPLVRTIIGPVEKMLWVLLGAVALVLLIAIGNMATLQIARLSGRAHEMGIRTALGAERARIVRQLLTESLLLTCAGGALGIALAYAAVHLLVRLNPGEIPRFDSTSVDGRVLLVGVLLSIGAGILSGFAPGILASRASINELLKRGANWGIAGSSYRERFGLIALEVAVSVILLAGSGLLIRSYLKLAAVNPGFSSETLTFRVFLDERYNKPELRAAFYKSLLGKLELIRGAKYVGASSSLPLSHHESVTFAEVTRPREDERNGRRSLGDARLSKGTRHTSSTRPRFY
jgi:putative ABC transport system permease protein